GAGGCRTRTERGQHAQEEDDVSRRSEADCRSTTVEVGEVQGGEEGGLRPRPRRSVQASAGSFLACLLWKCIEEAHHFCGSLEVLSGSRCPSSPRFRHSPQ